MMAPNKKDFASMLQQGGFANDPIMALASSFDGLMADVMAPGMNQNDIPKSLSNCFIGLVPERDANFMAA